MLLLQVLANVAGKPIEAILCEFRGSHSGTLADEQRLREQSDKVFAELAQKTLEGLDRLEPLATLDVLHAALHRLGIDATMEEAAAALSLHDLDATGALTADEFFSLALRLLGRSYSGDVKYHLGITQQRQLQNGRNLTISLLPNPSHLEAVNPLVVGLARAKQQRLGDRERRRVLPLLLHGDAAFCAQGVVFECLGLSDLFDYTTGGAVHVVVNNQIGKRAIAQQHPGSKQQLTALPLTFPPYTGFTTTPRQSRSALSHTAPSLCPFLFSFLTWRSR